MSKFDKRMVEAWRDVRIAQICEEFGMCNLMKWHQAETHEEVWDCLLAYSDEVLVDRFSMLNDTVSRVLNGGVVDRWNQRIMTSYNWMKDRMNVNMDVLSPEEKAKQVEMSLPRKKFFRHALARGKARSQRKLKKWEKKSSANGDAETSAEAIEVNFREVDLPDIDKDEMATETYLEFSEKLIMKYLTHLVQGAEKFCSKEYDFIHLGKHKNL
mmetsp:Transcript_53042/g.68013  ORF Transcript_53042/g.68013 Transcript_53042/m.68013 type:complete len:213 (+) Transcript_53042:73-711(+)